MTRREMLVRVFGAAAAAAVAPLVNLADSTADFWNQPPIQKLMPWRISFPDGTQFEFDAKVVSEEWAGDTVKLTMQALGGMRVSQSGEQSIEKSVNFIGQEEKDYDDAYDQLFDDPTPEQSGPAQEAQGTIVRAGTITGELVEIELPNQDVMVDWDVDDYVLKQLGGDYTFSIDVKPFKETS